jgi:hypothetical protein
MNTEMKDPQNKETTGQGQPWILFSKHDGKDQ